MPVAIIGAAFRLPGDLHDEAALWRVLLDGIDQVTEISAERWPVQELSHPARGEPGRSITFRAGVLSAVEAFDAAFFGISPREAGWMDPQQRLLLELAWEAMENAGCPPSRLAGSAVAVYVGVSGLDYGMSRLDDLSSMSAHTMTGNTLSIAANRLSYVFDLRGPSLAVDTACSSSLVALHHACMALERGEATGALVGGVNLLMHPYPFVGFTKASMLSGQGRCAAFEATADGYVRAEGAVMLLLKPLHRALADGDPIEAVIRGTGVNADGARKSGLTIPSAEGQTELMRSVLARSGLQAGDIDYLEAHGTGTAIGDPVEAAAIGAVYGAARRADAPLPVGSVKTNLGHLEPASGLAGLLKAVQVLKHGVVPPSLHAHTRNPRIDFAGLRLDPVSVATPLAPSGVSLRLDPAGGPAPALPEPGPARPWRAGVNSFGFGGSNAHVLLEQFLPDHTSPPAAGTPAAGQASEAAPPARESMPPPAGAPLVLSAATVEALRALAARVAGWLREGHGQDRAAVARAFAQQRDWLQQRLVLPANVPDWADTLETFAQGRVSAPAWHEAALPQPGGVAFVYSGNGSQWPGMASRLLAQSPSFRRHLSRLEGPLAALAGFSVLAELEGGVEADRLADTAVAQPLLFAIQVALTGMLREEGLEPAAVLGHSVGEVAAAWACGALPLDQATRVICARSAAQARTAGLGRMAAVSTDAASVQEMIARAGANRVELAAFNAPAALTVSGPLDQLQALQAQCRAAGKAFRLLDLDYAFHSAAMDDARGPLVQALQGLAPRPGEGAVRFVSTVSGQPEPGQVLEAGYWWRNVREPVRFQQGVQALLDQGCRVFVEVGPHAILQRYLVDCAQAARQHARVLPTLTRKDDSAERIAEAALRALVLQGRPALAGRLGGGAPHLRLPNYPWQRELHRAPASPERAGLLARHRVHPLLGWRLHDADFAWENVLDVRTHRWLADHCVGGAPVMAGAAFVELALAAAHQWSGNQACRLENLDIIAPLVFEPDHGRTVRVDLGARDHGFQVRSRQRLSDDAWTLHAVGRVAGTPARQPDAVLPPVADEVAAPGPSAAPADAIAGSARTMGRAELYALAASLGLDYGPHFRAFESGRRHGRELQGELRLEDDSATTGMLLPPGLLDACFQSMIAFLADRIGDGQALPLLPVRVGELHFLGSGRPASRFRSVLRQQGPRSVEADFELRDAHGALVAWLRGCRFRAAVLRLHRPVPPACWQHVLRTAPLASGQRTVQWPTTAQLVQAVREAQAEPEAGAPAADFHAVALPLFDALVVSAAYDSLRKLVEQDPAGAARLLQRGHATAAARDAGHASVANGSFQDWLLDLLRQQDLLQGEGSQAMLVSSDLPPADEIWRTLLRDFPGTLQELVPIGRVMARLPALLSGQADAAALAEELARGQSLEALYEESLAYAASCQALRALLRTLATREMPGRRLRVLELVPATGSHLAADLATRADQASLDYVLAHRDPAICARLADAARDLRFVQVAPLTPGGQAFATEDRLPDRFDAIVVRHSLHGFDHPASVLGWLHGLLAAGGLLIVAERNPDLAVDFQRGLSPGWWRPAVGGGLVSRLDARATWQHLLEAQGYTDVREWLEPGAEQELGGCFLLLAKRAASHGATATSTPAASIKVPPAARAERWLLLAGEADTRVLAGRLADLLRAQSQQVAIGEPDSVASTAAARLSGVLVAAEDGLGGLDHVVDLRALSPAGGEEMLAQELPSLTGCAAALALVHALRDRARPAPRLWWITRGAAPVAGLPAPQERRPLQAAIWGLGRVVANEWPEARCTLVDAGGLRSQAALPGLLAAELLEPDGEREIVLGARGRQVLRLCRQDDRVVARDGGSPGFRLDFQVPGQLRNLGWYPRTGRPLGDDDVEVRTAAVGLNFRDVMYVLGLLPDEAVENGFAGASLGLEFSGTVSRVGRRVTSVEVGDAVLGFAPSCFADHVVTSASALMRKPEGWSFESAATVPTVFFTAYYALRRLADVQPGERVLVHGAAGGVGIAAVQLALHLKAEVFATAGSGERRDFARLLGADRVFDSRSTAFADDILSATGGQGVDVILNSLAGEAMRRNLQILKPFGRFLELGKRDFYENTAIGIRPFKDNVSYFGIDADQLLVARPQLAARMFREVMALFRAGVLTPLPFRAFPARQVVDAFRLMQQARQIGKVVVTLAEPPPQVRPAHARGRSVHLRRDRTWLVTGGLQGFGLETARWLVQRGAGTVVLAGRRGSETPGAPGAVRELEALGARVVMAACDVTEREQVAELLARIARDHPPLAGIVHAAMQLEDGLLDRQDESSLRHALAPKVAGAWHLHELSIDLPLDHFVLYSSVTTAIGNPGQANYVAANAALEGLALMRRELGLPATCIGWGPIADAGYLSRHAEVREQLTRRTGAIALESARALAVLGRALADDESVLHVADLDWSAMARRLPGLALPRLAALTRDASGTAASPEGVEALMELLDGKSPEEVRTLVTGLVAREVAAILGIGEDRIDPARSLHDLGLDSLMGVELGLGLEKRFGLQLPPMLLNEGPSVERVAERIIGHLRGSGAGSETAPDSGLTALVTQFAGQHGEQVSDAEIQATVADLQKAG